jgi:hypothetical protein
MRASGIVGSAPLRGVHTARYLDVEILLRCDTLETSPKEGRNR